MKDQGSSAIRSRDNKHVKKALALQSKKAREELGLTLLEGVRLVSDVLRQGAAVDTLMYSDRLLLRPGGPELLEMAGRSVDEVLEVDSALLDRVSGTETGQGVVAFARIARHDVQALVDGAMRRNGILVLLEAIQDPGNVGSIIRSAAAQGAAGIVAGPGTADPWAPKTLRSGAGAAFRIPIASPDDWSATLSICGANLQVLLADVGGSAVPPWECDLTRATAIILGNEGSGPSEESTRVASARVQIPMPGGTESLNVAMSASVILYEAQRQRQISGGRKERWS
jgi:TrmH family RNA methyltransferase